MKRLILVVILAALLVVACGPPDDYCEAAWMSMEVEAGNEAWMVNFILNTEHTPNTVSAALKRCIKRGWVVDKAK